MTLYRKYRPQKFSDVEGQSAIIQTLKNELASGKIAHAYLFSGPRGIGKTTVARLLAKAINCRNKKSAAERRMGKVEPCNRCVSCQEITSNGSLDLIEIDAASNRGINEIRALRENVRFAGTANASKIFIIDEVHMLTREAANALLKTLEEPPANTVFILATTEAHEVPDTVLSRCQRFDFKKLTIAEIEHHLEKILKQEKTSLDPAILNLLAVKADGGGRDAVGLLGQILAWPKKDLTLAKVADFLGAVDWSRVADFARRLAIRDQAHLIREINKMVSDGQDLFNFTEKLIDYLRMMMLAKIEEDLADKEGSLTAAQKQEMLALAKEFFLKDLASLLRIFSSAKNNLENAPISQLPLELAVIEYAGAQDVVLEAQAAEAKPAAPILPPKMEIEKIAPIDSPLKPAASMEKVGEKWADVLKAVEPLNYSLCAFLKLCQPVAFRDGSLILGFPRDFHRNIVSQARNKKTVETVLDQILGGKWRIQCEKVEGRGENHFAREALEVLGGEIVR
ncbi:hypothetical protein COT68_03205 [bacterium (Candidatus Torokbacteria) CG09_land_8_20_14_0_10_42_11]|nr:MAG: hypothetical protein COT68_03205 [bacterium (Candidatus Torokbacteria) CG09_land_8_20_14_0_10_42_11]